MLNISRETKLPSEKIKEKIRDFFGEKGLKLDLTEEKNDCFNYAGGGGYVNLTICEEDGRNRVDVVTTEWEYQVKDFLAKL
jgi:hypothetical protein